MDNTVATRMQTCYVCPLLGSECGVNVLLVLKNQDAGYNANTVFTVHADYFCEVNVLATVHNFIRFCPDFWSSEQLQKTIMQGGEILQLDPHYFANVSIML